MTITDYNEEYAGQQLSRRKHPIRRFVKSFYLQNILKHVIGPTIDFGCGAGQLLEKLPVGSLGLEVNYYLVKALRKMGLKVSEYDPEVDLLSLSMLKTGEFSTLVMSHVLEHFDDPKGALTTILESCERLEIGRIIIIVPGKKGFEFDSTHRTFIDRAYMENNQILESGKYKVTWMKYFPFNVEKLGNYFTFHELMIVFDRIESNEHRFE